MTTPQFDELYSKLNENQKKAVDTIEGPVLVAAGPGTGKTQVLTLRIANILLKTQINPENILALTFTESAAFEMRQRLVNSIGAPGYHVAIYTFHGLCNMLIQNHPEVFSSLVSAKAATELDQIQIIEDILSENDLEILKPIGDPTYYVRPILGAINDLKKEAVTPEQLSEGLVKEEQDFLAIPDKVYTSGRFIGKTKGIYKDQEKAIAKNKELALVYARYQKILREKRLYDFNDMLLIVLETLERNGDFLLSLQERYQYILVDEHQDTNTAQNKIVELLCSFFEQPNIFVVGDDKQAIYRFQGASLENFLYFKTKYPSALFIPLDQNYRSTRAILDAAQSVIEKGAVLLPNVSLKDTVTYPSESIQLASFTTLAAEHAFIAHDIKEKIARGIPPEDIAILVRNNKDASPIIDALQQEKVPFFSYTEENIFDDVYIHYLVTLLHLIVNPNDDTVLFSCLHFPFFGISPLTLYQYIGQAHKEKSSLLHLLQIKQKAQDLDEPTDKFLRQLETWIKQTSSFSPTDIFVILFQESGLMKYVLIQEEAPLHLEKIHRLCSKLQELQDQQEHYSLAQFIDYLDLMKHHNLSLPVRTPEQLRTGVQLMTAHKAKGREFTIVYIAHAHEKGFGNDRARGSSFQIPWQYLIQKLSEDTGSEIDDERRLFYVALTRARRAIIITFAQTDNAMQHVLLSPFVTELEGQIITIPTEAFEKELLGSQTLITKQRSSPLSNKKEAFTIYLWNLLQEKGISATSLNDFLQCPWKFVFHDLLEVPEPKNEAMAYGSGIHRTIKAYIEKNKSLSSLEAIDIFKRIMQDERISPDMQTRCITQAERDLPGFLTNTASKWTHTLMSEVTVPNLHLGNPVPINGRIDLIEKIDNGWMIHDYKTGQPRSRNSLEKDGDEGNYKRQLIFYVLLLENWNNKRFATRSTVLDFVRPMESGHYKSEIFVITDEELQLVHQNITDCVEQTQVLSFWDNRCEEPQCPYCAFRDMISDNSL